MSNATNETAFCTQAIFTRTLLAGVYDAIGTRGGSRVRLQSGGMVAIESPVRAKGWELYATDEDGLEMFRRYANQREATLLAEVAKAEPDSSGEIRAFIGWR